MDSFVYESTFLAGPVLIVTYREEGAIIDQVSPIVHQVNVCCIADVVAKPLEKPRHRQLKKKKTCVETVRGRIRSIKANLNSTSSGNPIVIGVKGFAAPIVIGLVRQDARLEQQIGASVVDHYERRK